ncbi:SDR family NAD(P)-dependent oxidoreductase [Balneolaceae bacterium YR4-1]|uniref:SDR family NAD(P)-dependent oxidoreductase n=1 Tax=Halalkalibaculum roseum TaxID=2709311 RepID=A0A6M1SJM0_9BACT|nr:SDR family NAD(P)-dependent oxidoreductase [Halalkalibaculum roseum]NGP75219.1 SDR family NAD(P)-dependent oxidoreductase [Halalkalibaculum roseum]
MDFSDLHIIVTGGTGALGTATVNLLLEGGARCSIPCYDKSELDKFEFKDHEQVFIDTGIDLTDEQAAGKFFEKAVEESSPLWASIHIAGGFGMGDIEESTKADFMKQINLNLVTCYNSCRNAIRLMKESGKGGRIVNIASRPALEPRQGAGMSAYTTSKAGVAALTQSLAAEVASDDILINAIAPSIIDTTANRNSMPDADYSKWPKPVEIAHQIAYLVSKENYVTRGGVIPVYGKS